MTQQLTFTRFDVGNLRRQPRQYVVAFVFVVAVAAISPLSVMAIPAAGLMISVLTGPAFAHDERGRLDTLYGVLPVSRTSVVIGRYLTTAALWLAITVVASIAAVVAPLARGRMIDPGLLVPMVILGFGVAALAAAIQLPFFFALGYTKARPVAYAPAVVIGALAFASTQLGLLDGAGIAEHLVLPIAVGAVIAGIAVLIVSMIISIRLYTRRQL